MLCSHPYLKTEVPIITINAWIEGGSVYEETLEKYRTGKVPSLWSCDTPQTHYVYSEPAFTYFNNTCNFDIVTGQIRL